MVLKLLLLGFGGVVVEDLVALLGFGLVLRFEVCARCLGELLGVGLEGGEEDEEGNGLEVVVEGDRDDFLSGCCSKEGLCRFVGVLISGGGGGCGVEVGFLEISGEVDLANRGMFDGGGAVTGAGAGVGEKARALS